MATTFYPDFSKLSQYNEDSGTVVVRYGADAPVTEMELNEAQLVQNAQRKRLVDYLIEDGLSSEGTITFSGGKLTITGKRAFKNGYTVYIDSASITLASGQTAYLNIFEKTVGPNDAMKKYGNEGGTNITNYIMDARYGQEISKRIQVVYELSTSTRSGAQTITLGTNNSGVWNPAYTTARITANCGGMDTKYSLYRNAKEIPLTWSQIQQRCTSNNFEGIEIGDYKRVTLEGDFAGTVIYLEVAGIDTYYGYGSNNKHHIDFVTRDVLCKHRMNATNDTTGGWASMNMELYTYLNTTIYNSLPAEVRAVIGVKRLYLENKPDVESTGGSWFEENKLWLLGDIEVCGRSAFADPTWGGINMKQYPLFMGSDAKRIKKLNGSAWWYWLIQPDKRNKTGWCTFGSFGTLTTIGAGDEDGGVVFGLRVS